MENMTAQQKLLIVEMLLIEMFIHHSITGRYFKWIDYECDLKSVFNGDEIRQFIDVLIDIDTPFKKRYYTWSFVPLDERKPYESPYHSFQMWFDGLKKGLGRFGERAFHISPDVPNKELIKKRWDLSKEIESGESIVDGEETEK